MEMVKMVENVKLQFFTSYWYKPLTMEAPSIKKKTLQKTSPFYCLLMFLICLWGVFAVQVPLNQKKTSDLQLQYCQIVTPAGQSESRILQIHCSIKWDNIQTPK